MKALEIKDLKKKYKNGVQALRGITFSVEEGDFFALLGPNGAGKSTTIGIITSLVNKTSGSVVVYGYDIDKDFAQAKSYIGVVPQEFNFNTFEKVIDIVINEAGYYGIPRKVALTRAEKYLKQLGLWDKRKNMARSLSGGMKRRLMIARGLIHEPRMLVLDEPTAGVDIEIRRSMWKFLTDLNKQGVTIILTTHYFEEAENLCRHVAIIDKGEIIENTSMSNLLRQLEYEHFILYLDRALAELPHLEGFHFHQHDDRTLEVEVPHELGLSRLFELLNKKNIKVNSMRNKANRLEELFIKLTSEKKYET